MLHFVYDTETTGLPLFREPSDDPRQPRLTQVAAGLFDDAGRCVRSFSALVKPDGWVIPDEIIKITGITQNQADEFGIPEDKALEGLIKLWSMAGIRVAHNQQFDARIIRIGLMRYPKICDPGLWSEGADSFCTANATVDLCNLPPTDKMLAAGIKRPKTPKLTEAYRHIFGHDMAGTHNALADLMGCAAIYFALRDSNAGLVREAAE